MIVEVEHVAREQQAGLCLPQRDAPGRVAGDVQHDERSVPQVDDVAVLDERARLGPWAHPPAHVEGGVRQRVDQQLGDRQPVDRELVLGIRREVPTPHTHRVRRTDVVGVAGVAPTVLEPREPAHVVEMAVRRHGDDRDVAHERLDRRRQVAEPVRGVDHQRALPAAENPDVRQEQRVDVGLVEAGQPVADVPNPEPRIGDGELDLGHPVSSAPRRTPIRPARAGSAPTSSTRCSSPGSAGRRYRPPRPPGTAPPRRTGRRPR